MLSAPLVALLVLARAQAELIKDETSARLFLHKGRSIRDVDGAELPRGCLYEGRWFVEGARVAARDACLRCACARGALACSRRACAALPDPPPHRCHLLHRRGACCPELHCPDGVTAMEHAASTRRESEDYSDIATPASLANACVEGGTVYAAGSALGSRTACEQCFCLRGARRCVRPRCLPPPPGCSARPAPGACCPQRYYCDPATTHPPHQRHPHECEVDGALVSEGERVTAAEADAECTQCFCLRGAVRCQPLACAPPLQGCTPLLREGQCCPHQYRCDHQRYGQSGPVKSKIVPISDNSLISMRYADRSFHTSKSNKDEATTAPTATSVSTTKNAPTVSASKKEPASTTKVKRKTNDPPPTSTSHKPAENITKTATTTTTQKPTTTTKASAKLVETTTDEQPASTSEDNDTTSTEQPEGSVKIMINGTINCTAELSTSLPFNATLNETDRIKLEAQPRIPYISGSDIEAHTSNPNDIITDRYVNGGFDENETFTINVTSSLRTNTSHSTTAPSLTTTAKMEMPTALADALNISKKTKGDYDYDYTEPTLPPSLPNLKIIPFLAADAVVDEDVSSKESLTHPMLEREDKFPVYYPNKASKDTTFATRREDVYHPTQYPVFISGKADKVKYPSLTHKVNLNPAYPSVSNDLVTPMHEYTVSTSIGSRAPDVDKIVTKTPSASSTFEVETPAVNLFSPPMETEGGFIPKGPGIIDEYFAAYPSTPSGPTVPHLTTSMQLDTGKGECISADGRRVAEGDSIALSCSVCTCAWSELHCSPRPCHTPPGCQRRPASSSAVDLCCGELVCEGKKSTPAPTLPSHKTEINLNDSEGPMEIYSEMLPFDPPADRREPPTSKPVTQDVSHKVTTEVTQNNFDNSTSKPAIDKNINNFNTANELNITKEEITHSDVTSTEKLTTTTTVPTTMAPIHKEINETTNQPVSSQEYDDDEEDEGFSFGSVLKLLLSESYDTTTASPYKKKLETTTTRVDTSTAAPVSTTRRSSPKPAIGQFMPIPAHSYIPPKKVLPQNTVNRIDHLVLGEATAIKRTTHRPLTTPQRPVTTPIKVYTTRLTTAKPIVTTRAKVTKEDHSDQYTSVTRVGPRPSASNGFPGVGGLLKLAGCNIYGRMYRVGRIIAELSTPCQECLCTELGVQCHSLNC